MGVSCATEQHHYPHFWRQREDLQRQEGQQALKASANLRQHKAGFFRALFFPQHSTWSEYRWPLTVSAIVRASPWCLAEGGHKLGTKASRALISAISEGSDPTRHTQQNPHLKQAGLAKLLKNKHCIF